MHLLACLPLACGRLGRLTTFGCWTAVCSISGASRICSGASFCITVHQVTQPWGLCCRRHTRGDTPGVCQLTFHLEEEARLFLAPSSPPVWGTLSYLPSMSHTHYCNFDSGVTGSCCPPARDAGVTFNNTVIYEYLQASCSAPYDALLHAILIGCLAPCPTS